MRSSKAPEMANCLETPHPSPAVLPSQCLGLPAESPPVGSLPPSPEKDPWQTDAAPAKVEPLH